ncbi:hypothetical protein C1Y63_09105 [Corynebacterium sp. 13CS0277]|nr:hypothetical protein C1Y63_09105 [Corynebacterium sp. 13CS0277]
MKLSGAKARHRELTQAVYDIGDEVAEYVEHIAQAVADWDVELVEDCLDEFEEILHEGRSDARSVLGELAGLRQALTTGLHSGNLSVHTGDVEEIPAPPEPVTAVSLVNDFPLGRTVAVEVLQDTLEARTERVHACLEDTCDWVVATASAVARDLDAANLPLCLSKAHRIVTDAAHAWIHAVHARDRSFARAQRGHNPPRFLFERAQTDAVVARVRKKLAERATSTPAPRGR